MNCRGRVGLMNCVWPVDPMLNWRSTWTPSTATRYRWTQKFVKCFLYTFMGFVYWTLKKKASYEFHRTTTLFKKLVSNVSFVPWLASWCHVIEGSTTDGLLLLLKRMTTLNRVQQVGLKKSVFDEIGKTVYLHNVQHVPLKKIPHKSSSKKTVENIILA